MKLQPSNGLGSMPSLRCSEHCFSSRITALLILVLAVLTPLRASAGAPLRDPPPFISPLEKEQDRQDKMRQQEKIDRELEEQRRRVLKEAERNWIKGEYEVSPNSSRKQDAPASRTRPSN